MSVNKSLFVSECHVSHQLRHESLHFLDVLCVLCCKHKTHLIIRALQYQLPVGVAILHYKTTLEWILQIKQFCSSSEFFP